MGNYNDFDLDIKKVQGENDIGPASITTTIKYSLQGTTQEMCIRDRNTDSVALTANRGRDGPNQNPIRTGRWPADLVTEIDLANEKLSHHSSS